MTKGLSRKQIIISTSINNVKIVTAQSNTYIVNINRLLKEVKSEISADYIHFDNKRIVIITNKTVISSNLNIVEKYIKELNYVDSNNIISPRLLQSKSYFKILDILYFLENTNLPVMSDIIERVIKSIHIFNNMVLVSCSWVIKAFPKSDMAIVCVNIWDSQNDTNPKCLINRCLNIEQYIIMMRGTNINSNIS